MIEPTKMAFQKTWPGGYGENFVVYKQQTGASEEDIVSRCLEPFYWPSGAALEIGCGVGFWPERHLCKNFKTVVGLDVIPPEWVKVSHKNFTYREVPDRNYTCYGVANDSIDFVFSFGCFCHLPIPAIEEYLKNIVRVLTPGGIASLYFSNTERRPGTETKEDANIDPNTNIIWVPNNWQKTWAMMHKAGFADIRDLWPEHKDTVCTGRKR